VNRRHFSKRAKRNARVSRDRTEEMLRGAHLRSGPVTISYLPGFEPPATPPPPPSPPGLKTKFPFAATINGRPITVHSLQRVEYLDDVWFGDPEDRDDAWLYHGLGLDGDA
jgi:hypothetical protein